MTEDEQLRFGLSKKTNYLATDQENIMINFSAIRKYHVTYAEILIFA